MVKTNSREAMRAAKEADVVIQSMGRASESAVATTLASITQTLRGNTPLMYHIHALLNNEEWKAVMEASALGQNCGDKPAGSGGDKPAPSKGLRTNVKKFEHLPRLLHRSMKKKTFLPLA